MDERLQSSELCPSLLCTLLRFGPGSARQEHHMSLSGRQGGRNLFVLGAWNKQEQRLARAAIVQAQRLNFTPHDAPKIGISPFS